MATDAETVSAAVRELRARAPVTNIGNYVSQDIPFDAMEALTDQLIADEGLETIVSTLAPHRDDPDVAEVLFFICWTNDRDISDVFSDEEIVEAALEFLLAFQGEEVDIRNVPGWGWSALFQHIDYGRNDHLTDEAHFRMLLKLIEKVPLNDNILFMIGDGPLSHAAGKRNTVTASWNYRRRTQRSNAPGGSTSLTESTTKVDPTGPFATTSDEHLTAAQCSGSDA